MHAAFLEPRHGPGADEHGEPESHEDDARHEVRGVAPRLLGRLLLRFGLAHFGRYCLTSDMVSQSTPITLGGLTASPRSTAEQASWMTIGIALARASAP